MHYKPLSKKHTIMREPVPNISGQVAEAVLD